MFLVIDVILIEMEKHFRAGRCGDASADNALDVGEARQELWRLTMGDPAIQTY